LDWLARATMVINKILMWFGSLFQKMEDAVYSVSQKQKHSYSNISICYIMYHSQ